MRQRNVIDGWNKKKGCEERIGKRGRRMDGKI
jgi:hypothetical protein